MLKKAISVLLIVVIMATLIGCGKDKAINGNDVYEKLYSVTENALSSFSEMFEALDSSNEYTAQYLENPSREALERARIATVSALNTIDSLRTPEFKLSEEELLFCEENNILVESFSFLCDSEFNSLADHYRNVVKTRNIDLFSNIHIKGNRELLIKGMPTERSILNGDMDGVFLSLNAAFVNFPQEKQTEYVQKLKDKFPIIFSGNYKWEDTEQAVQENYEQLLAATEELLNEKSYLVGMNSGDLEMLKKNGLEADVPEKLSNTVPIPGWIEFADDKISYKTVDASGYPEIKNQITIVTPSVENELIEQYSEAMKLVGYNPAELKKTDDGTIIGLKYQIKDDVLTVTRNGEEVVFCSDINDISLVSLFAILKTKGIGTAPTPTDTAPTASTATDSVPTVTTSTASENAEKTGNEDKFSGYRKISLPDGASYEGNFRDGKYCGQGTLTLDNGTVLKGEFRDNLLNGEGTMTFSDGMVYEGDFKDGKYCGQGTLTLANGTVYRGEFKDNFLNGKGTRTTVKGDFYEGNFKDGDFHGKGILTLSSKAVYEGEFNQGSMSGQGKYTSPDGAVFAGTFKDGLLCGEGTHTTADGDYFEGTFEKSRLHGYGKVVYTDGGVYEGEWKYGKPDGEGSMLYSSGDFYSGEYKDAKRHGEGVYIFANGNEYEGEFFDGSMSGQGKMTTPDGAVYEGEWKNGQPEGQGKTLLANGNTHTGGYLAGERHGYGVYTYAGGDVYEGEFKAHKFHGYGVYTYADGTVKKGMWENDELIEATE